MQWRLRAFGSPARNAAGQPKRHFAPSPRRAARAMPARRACAFARRAPMRRRQPGCLAALLCAQAKLRLPRAPGSGTQAAGAGDCSARPRGGAPMRRRLPATLRHCFALRLGSVCLERPVQARRRLGLATVPRGGALLPCAAIGWPAGGSQPFTLPPVTRRGARLQAA
jgi:hypothetical protein